MASVSLGVSRSTVLRRIAALEERLAVRLFERLPSGYFATKTGEELLITAIEIEKLAMSADRRLAGRDSNLEGSIRVALPASLISGPMAIELANFSQQHSHIKLELITSYGMPDLFAREADIAIRVSNNPPDDLVGRRILSVARCCYVATHLLDNIDLLANQKMIGWSVDAMPSRWYHSTGHDKHDEGAVIDDPVAALEAVRAGMGKAILPCFMGDIAPGVSRVPPGKTFLNRDLWVLTHKDLRKTARIRLFTDFIAEALLRHRNIYEGKGTRMHGVDAGLR